MLPKQLLLYLPGLSHLDPANPTKQSQKKFSSLSGLMNIFLQTPGFRQGELFPLLVHGLRRPVKRKVV